MAVPLFEVGRRGRLDLIFSSVRGRTVIRDAYCEIPFKITRLHDSHPSKIAHLILMQSTAGLFGGDSTECTIHVESGARILITQQAATKAHPSSGKQAMQTNRFRVEAGGELHIYLDPLIPFCGARVLQTTSIDVDPGGRLCFWEGLMAGRIGRDEIWQFEEFSSETALRVNGRLLYLDRFRLRPGKDPPNSEWMMGSARYLATGLCFDECAADFAEQLHLLLPGEGTGIDTPAPGLTVARVVALNGPEFHRYRSVFESVSSGRNSNTVRDGTIP
jgi:urease accessory protein